ncbi:hypothetical protein ACQR50_17010 [Sphingomonas sp. Xoc002]|uniref:hypothetical protein n=1 Tax=Sphingomonas sp. Xoc002 TaxID=2837624 RepID=UPI003D16300B
MLLSAVWQHVAPADRPRAFRKLATLMKPGGVMVMTLHRGASPAPSGYPDYAALLDELPLPRGLSFTRHPFTCPHELSMAHSPVWHRSHFRIFAFSHAKMCSIGKPLALVSGGSGTSMGRLTIGRR